MLVKEHPSSDSFYDSEGDGGSELTTVERPGSMCITGHEEEDSVDGRQRHDSAEVDGIKNSTQIEYCGKQ